MVEDTFRELDTLSYKKRKIMTFLAVLDSTGN